MRTFTGKTAAAGQDQARIGRVQDLEAEAELVQRSGAVVFDDDVRLRGQRQKQLLAAAGS